MLEDFFYLQRNDRQAVIAILSIITLALALVMLIGNSHEPTPTMQDKDSVRTEKGVSKEPVNDKEPLYYKMDGTVHELFPFDPNTADRTELLRLGLNAWQISGICRYRSKGGIYRTPRDFAQLYGLTKKQYEILEPYIRISDDYKPASDFYKRESYKETYQETRRLEPEQADKPVYHYPHKLKSGEHISVNSADTTELQKIPGIGRSYAKAIVRYREKLGGFTSSTQLLEIEGLPESAVPFITIDTGGIRKLDINHLSLNQLRQHPYINFYQAKAICDYRRLRGPIKCLEELKLLKDFPPAEIERLQPYISF